MRPADFAPALQIDRLMGSEIDARKLVSSMTLFAVVAGYSTCEHTLAMLRSDVGRTPLE